MDAKDRISIVIPYCNRAEWLPRTLASLQKIAYRPIEIIFVDNNSADNSRALVEKFMAEQNSADFSIRLIDEPRQGAAAARNAGLRLVESPFVYFFDSDDVISADYLSDAQPYMADADIVACATKMRFADGRERVRKVFHNASATDQILVCQLATQGMLIRTGFLRKAGGWNEMLPLWNDWELGFRLLKLSPRIIWLQKAYHTIMQHADSLTGSSHKANFPHYLTALAAVENRALTTAEREALLARKVILSAELASEGAQAEARQLLASVSPKTLPLKILYLYARFIHRGGWWIYRTFSMLKYGRQR